MFALVASISYQLPTATGTKSCSWAEETTTGCPTVDAGIYDDEAVIGGSTTTRDDSNQHGTAGHGHNDADQDSDVNSGASSGVPGQSGNNTSNCPIGTWGCQMRDDYEVVVVTLSDIARFRPSPGIQRMEPDGWVVVGLPANIYSIVDRQIVPGELLGQSADVRFTPVAWHWSYGDGATATLATKGGTWAALGLDEFDATPTSHVYERAGSYTIRLSISFRAEYRIAGGPFVPIVGTITLPANELHITASGAKTVLVDRDCTIAPRGPGC